MSLVELLGLGAHELVAIVGAGGKSTLMATLGAELAEAGHTVLATTTTKMGSGQTDRFPTVVWVDDVLGKDVFRKDVLGKDVLGKDVLRKEGVDATDLRTRPGPILVLERGDERKVTGPAPHVVGALFATSDYMLVEADGARGRSFKAPAEHEPVIPAATTYVAIVMGADAFGRPIAEAAHRPERVVALSGREASAAITPAVVASVVGHRDGGLRGVPQEARIAVVVTKVADEADRRRVRDLAAGLEQHPRIERVVAIAATARSG